MSKESPGVLLEKNVVKQLETVIRENCSLKAEIMRLGDLLEAYDAREHQLNDFISDGAYKLGIYKKETERFERDLKTLTACAQTLLKETE